MELGLRVYLDPSLLTLLYPKIPTTVFRTIRAKLKGVYTDREAQGGKSAWRSAESALKGNYRWGV